MDISNVIDIHNIFLDSGIEQTTYNKFLISLSTNLNLITSFTPVNFGIIGNVNNYEGETPDSENAYIILTAENYNFG